MAGVSWVWVFGVVIFLMAWKSEKNPPRDGGGFLDLGFWSCDFQSWRGDPKIIHLGMVRVSWIWDFGVVIFFSWLGNQKNPPQDGGGFLDLGFLGL